MSATPKTGLIIGIVATPIFLLLAVGSMGAGHGNYRCALFFYPILTYVMLLGAGLLALPLALCQYPFYGWFICRCISKKQFTKLTVVMLLLQIIPMILLLVL